MSTTEPQDTVQNTVSPVQQRTVKPEPVVTTKVQTETETIPYSQQTIEDDSLAKGSTVVRVAGVEGVKTVTHTITYTDGIETDRTTSEAVTVEPVTEVTAIGTYVAPQPREEQYVGGVVK